MENNQLYDILMSDDIVKSINENMDYLLKLIPEINQMIGFDQKHPHHHLDLWNHTLYALSLSEIDFDIRLSLLLHDIGKPNSCKEDEVRHYKNHPIVSAKISREILSRLGYDKDYIDYICFLIEHHDEKITEEQIDTNYDLYKTLYKIQKCDGLAHHPDKLEKRKKYLFEIEEILKKRER